MGSIARQYRGGTAKTMMKLFIKYVVMLFVVAFAGTAISGTANAVDGDALLQRVDAIRAPAASFTFTLKVEIEGDTNQEMEVSIRERTKGLVRYTKPAKVAGRSILFVDRNMWVYVPGSRRALRISPQQRVLGGVSSADVARIVYSLDYKVDSLTENGDNITLKLIPKGSSAAYGGVDLLVDSTGAPQQAVFFTTSGRKLKTTYFEDYQDILGEMRPTKLRVIDHLENDAVTTMIYDNFERTETPASWYQPGNLSRF